MVRKPGIDDEESVNEIIKTVRAMAGVPTVRRFDKRKPRKLQPGHERQINAGREEQPAEDLAHPVFDEREVNSINMIGIVSSTGGPGVLTQILTQLPKDFHIPIMIVQHVTDGFAVGLADWLDRETDIFVGLASHGERPRRGSALIAPDGYHTRIDKQGNIELFKADPYKGLLPSGNYLLSSIAEWYRSHAMGIILTGMGDDGAEGIEGIHRNSGVTISQEEKSCVVYGMPREAVRLNVVDYILTPQQIGEALKQLVRPSIKEAIV